MRIAVCDDRADDRGTLKALLEACGQDFEIREYGSGKSLCGDMDYIRECGIVFLDINMNGMDGLEAAGQIKAECPKVHIVLVTAYVNYALDDSGSPVYFKKITVTPDDERAWFKTHSQCSKSNRYAELEARIYI